jgi:hypothetical protein
MKGRHDQAAMLPMFLEIDAEQSHTEMFERRGALRTIP